MKTRTVAEIRAETQADVALMYIGGYFKGYLPKANNELDALSMAPGYMDT